MAVSLPNTGKTGQNAPNVGIRGSSIRTSSVQEVFKSYIDYLEAERNASAYGIASPSQVKDEGRDNLGGGRAFLAMTRWGMLYNNR